MPTAAASPWETMVTLILARLEALAHWVGLGVWCLFSCTRTSSLSAPSECSEDTGTGGHRRSFLSTQGGSACREGNMPMHASTAPSMPAFPAPMHWNPRCSSPALIPACAALTSRESARAAPRPRQDGVEGPPRPRSEGKRLRAAMPQLHGDVFISKPWPQGPSSSPDLQVRG